jgi:hypothetical protein
LLVQLRGHVMEFRSLVADAGQVEQRFCFRESISRRGQGCVRRCRYAVRHPCKYCQALERVGSLSQYRWSSCSDWLALACGGWATAPADGVVARKTAETACSSDICFLQRSFVSLTIIIIIMSKLHYY